jgi:hypothetical protein
MGLLTSFYHNSAAVNKKVQGALGGNFIDPDSLGFVYHSHCAAIKQIFRFKYTQILGYRPLARI